MIMETGYSVGQDINGESSDDDFGISVDISANGDIVAIGAPANDGDGSDITLDMLEFMSLME